MLNTEYKKVALEENERVLDQYKEKYTETINRTTVLHNYKESAVSILKIVEEYYNSLANVPIDITKKISEIILRRKEFEKEVKDLKIESKKAENISGGIAGAGVATGAGIAAFGPSAAMAVATTFGTASTGTAIASLSGAAATNAALAWIGGGALTAGGGGMVAGEAFLAMAGPVGWFIGGVALLGGGLLANSKNKEIAEKAENQTKQMKKEIDYLNRVKTKVNAEINAIYPLNTGVISIVNRFIRKENHDYNIFSDEEKMDFMCLINSALALSERIKVKIE